MERPRISIILVNYNDRIHLPDCLASLERIVAALPAEVILVDNHSEDGSPEAAESFRWVKLIRNEKNVGYARANNIGIETARGDFLLFLNTDTVIPENSLPALLAELEARPEAGAIGPALVRDNSRPQVSFGREVNFVSELWQKLFRNPYFRIVLRFGVRTREVGWLSGACLLARRQAVENAGRFDENFFLYFEDIDLCKRLTEKGYRIVFFPGIRVIHVGGASTSQGKWRCRLEYRKSQVYYYRKHNSELSLRLLKAFLRLNFGWRRLRSRTPEEKSALRELELWIRREAKARKIDG
jgi:GT2 family glycosyltransferase